MHFGTEFAPRYDAGLTGGQVSAGSALFRVEGAPLRVCVSDAADARLRAAAAYSLLINIPSALLGMSLADVQARSPRRASEQTPWRVGDTDLEICFDRSNASSPRRTSRYSLIAQMHPVRVGPRDML